MKQIVIIMLVVIIGCQEGAAGGNYLDPDTESSSDGDTDTDSDSDADGDSCEDIICDDPPDPYCKDGYQIQPGYGVHNKVVCINGECIYPYSVQPCFSGECAGNVCSGACENIICNEPPYSNCEQVEDQNNNFYELLYSREDNGTCIDASYIPVGWCLYRDKHEYCPNGCIDVDSDDDYCAE